MSKILYTHSFIYLLFKILFVYKEKIQYTYLLDIIIIWYHQDQNTIAVSLYVHLYPLLDIIHTRV